MGINNHIKHLLVIVMALTMASGLCSECFAKDKKQNNNIPLNDIITSVNKIVKGTTVQTREFKNLELTLKPTRAGITIRF